MAMSSVQAAEQEKRRRAIGQLIIGGVPKGEIAETIGCSKQTITREIKLLIAAWNKEMVKDPVAHRARTLATMQEQERIAAKRYGIAAPIRMDHHPDEDVRFTIEFEPAYAPRTIDAKYDVFALEDPSLMERE